MGVGDDIGDIGAGPTAAARRWIVGAEGKTGAGEDKQVRTVRRRGSRTGDEVGRPSGGSLEQEQVWQSRDANGVAKGNHTTSKEMNWKSRKR